MKQVIGAVALDTEGLGCAPGAREPDTEVKCFAVVSSANNVRGSGTTRASLRIRLAKMLFAELLQLFALETWRSCWQAFSPLRGLSDCERQPPSTRAFLVSSP